MNGAATEKTITVPASASGMRVDIFLVHACDNYSRALLQKLIAAGNVTVNGSVVPKRYRLSEGETVVIHDLESFVVTTPVQPEEIPLEIIYEDDAILAVNKAAGIVVHPGIGNRSGTLVNALLYYCSSLSAGSHKDRPGIVHRLDKQTSGVLLVAKTNRIHWAMARAFSSREIQKTYMAFCIGIPPEMKGTIDTPLGRNRNDPVKRAPDAQGKPSVTEYEMVETKDRISLVRLMPHTGRTHQIRVHCSSAGFPLVADDLYGGGKGRLERIPPAQRPFAQSLYNCFTRHALHALAIAFIHPATRREMTITAPYPADFQAALSLIGREDLV
ncbi:MAG: RluA family pseudouridine synthase [Chitinispirillaceae bacterium]|nr:RluA family pseudouridine synthase [Chitinispirillaceae bacterium]